MARSRSIRTTSVPLTSVSSGARIIDLLPLPLPVFIAVRLITLVIKHWYLVGLAILILFFPWYYSLLLAVSLPAAYLMYIWSNNTHHTLPSVVRASYYFAYTRMNWNSVCAAGEMQDGPKHPRMIGVLPRKWWWRPPRIANSKGTALTLVLDTSTVNADARSIELKRDAISDNLKAKRVRVRKLRPGYTEMTIEWERNPNSSVLPIGKESHPGSQAIAELDEGVHIELDTSILVVGESNSGKSNLSWNIFNELNKTTTPYHLYVLDPKRVEMADLEGSPHTMRYADRMSDFETVIKDFHSMMEQTLADMKEQGIRKVEISEDNPLNILVIDELLLLKMATRTDVTETPLGQILIVGRAAGFIVIANTQLSQVDAVGRIRDLFPQRVCLAVKSSAMTNATLGPSAEERGARCSEITEKGVGFIYQDATGNFSRFRPPLIEDTRMVARGEVFVPPEVVSPRPKRTRGAYTYVLWPRGTRTDSDGRALRDGQRPLYVGKAINPSKRLKQHESEQPWWDDVEHRLTEISTRYSSEEEALEAETALIHELHPIYNLAQRNYE